MNGDTMVLAFAVAIYIGTAMSSFFQSIVNDLVMPVIAGLFGADEKKLDTWTVSFGPVVLKVGGVISALINLCIAYIVVYLTLPYLRAYIPPSIGGRK